jgi:hypothetical protein
VSFDCTPPNEHLTTDQHRTHPTAFQGLHIHTGETPQICGKTFTGETSPSLASMPRVYATAATLLQCNMRSVRDRQRLSSHVCGCLMPGCYGCRPAEKKAYHARKVSACRNVVRSVGMQQRRTHQKSTCDNGQLYTNQDNSLDAQMLAICESLRKDCTAQISTAPHKNANAKLLHGVCLCTASTVRKKPTSISLMNECCHHCHI